jgi:hypothetical protein
MRSFKTSVLAGVLFTTVLSAQTVKTILNNGPVTNRYDVVILGDGYQAAEQAKFDADCLASINYLFGRPSYGAYKEFFNVHTVFRASVDSGADEPDKSPPIVKNTVYDSTFNYGGTPRCLYIKNTAQAAADSALAPDVEGRVIVLVNTTRYGGCAATYAVSYTGSSGPQVQAHEFGHSFGRLADEYDYGKSGTYSGPEPAQPNVTKDSTGMAKWPLWVGFNGIGAFEGAKYYKKGLFRPKSNCMMKSNGTPLCEVCNEAIVKQAYVTVDPIENASPASSTLTVTKPSSQVFSFDSLVPGASTITWKVNGTSVATAATSFTWDTSSYAAGSYTVSVTVADDTTFVRSDPTDLLESTKTWTVTLKENSNCLSTTMAGGNGLTAVNSGNMFDVKVLNKAGINVTSLDVRSRLVTGKFVIEVYITPNTYVGKDTNAAVWTLAARSVATSAGSSVPTTVNVSDFYLPAGEWGMYVLYLNGGIHYTNGNTTNQTASNSDLSLSLGIAKTAKFGGSTFNPRVWNGKICYSTDDVAALGHYGWGCGASATGIPQWSWNGPPALGAQIRASITGMNPAGGPLFWWIGLINNAGVDISAIGMPDCSLFAFPIGLTIGMSQTGGTKSNFGFNIGNNTSFIGAKIANQIGAIDPGANALGVSMTDAVAMRVGN